MPKPKRKDHHCSIRMTRVISFSNEVWSNRINQPYLTRSNITSGLEQGLCLRQPIAGAHFDEMVAIKLSPVR
jgi:hypothetical protein